MTYKTRKIKDGEKEEIYLCLSRLVKYKKVDLAVEAFNRIGKKLVVIGGGEQLDYLKSIAKPNIIFLGRQPDEVVREYYRKCKAFIFPGEEDFGITPVEAQACGTPVIAYGKGGATETVIDGITGVFFKEQTEESLIDAVDRFEKISIDKLAYECGTSTTTTGSVTATVTLKDNESGVNAISSRWIYNTTSGAIGENESSYTGGSFSSGQTITLKATTAGTYYLHVLTVDNAGNKKETISSAVTVEEALVADGNYNASKGVNTPKLGSGMTPIKWNGSSWVNTTGSDKDWYDYTSKKWANAKTSDGSMWVWIPRYAYSITSGYHSSSAGNIEVEFMKGLTNETSTGRKSFNNASGQGKWNIHPAFNYGQTVSGIWVAKFEASNSGGKIKVEPGVQSWRSITVNDIYTNCLNYNKTLNSHMMKNDEWGAVAYLSKSKYGKQNEEVWINNSSSYITGSAGNSASAGSNEGTVRFTAGESISTIKSIILKLNAPEKNADKFYLGNYDQMNIYITKANTDFNNFAGNWKPVEITNKLNWINLEIPAEDYTNLPETFNADDYLEIVNTNDSKKIIPHVTGSLKNYFCGSEHEVSFLSVENFFDMSMMDNWDGIDIIYYTIKGANKYFSATKSEPADLKIGFYKVDDNTINIFIHEYVPTDFFYSSFNDTFFGEWNFNAPSVFGITYKFTRIQ